MKVVINSKIGGFSLTKKAFKRLIELGYSRRSRIEET